MASDLGSGVSRTLSALDRLFKGVVFQKGKPPLDAEFNLQDSIHNESLRQQISANMSSGFLMDPTRSEFDYKFSPNWVNHFRLGAPRVASGTHDSAETQPVVWANVNGWILPVAGGLTLLVGSGRARRKRRIARALAAAFLFLPL